MARRDWPVIVGGCHRSGTSLLRRVLNAHSRIHCGPEVTFFRDLYGEYPADPLTHLRFFSTARTMASESDLLDVMGGAFIALHERAAVSAGKVRWADKAPENVLYLPDWQRLLGDCWLFVHVVRNPLDTLASIKQVRFPLTIPSDLEGRIAFYRTYTQAGAAFGVLHPVRYYRVAYEDLVGSPESTLGSLMHWLGEAFESTQLAFNDVRHERGLEDPNVASTTGIHSASVGRWASVLSPEEASAIRTATGDLWDALNRGAMSGVAS
jgi:hypothetical protein